jgi:hypothetical protein
VSVAPKHPEYRCPDGHVFWSENTLEPSPETLPCPHVSEGSQDACRKEGKRFHGRSD